jgi:hypothetical protein
MHHYMHDLMIIQMRYALLFFSPLHSFCVLYTTLERLKLEYASVVLNSITLIVSSKLEGVQRKFGALCCRRFLPAYVAIIMKVLLNILFVTAFHEGTCRWHVLY